MISPWRQKPHSKAKTNCVKPKAVDCVPSGMGQTRAGCDLSPKVRQSAATTLSRQREAGCMRSASLHRKPCKNAKHNSVRPKAADCDTRDVRLTRSGFHLRQSAVTALSRHREAGCMRSASLHKKPSKNAKHNSVTPKAVDCVQGGVRQTRYGCDLFGRNHFFSQII